LTGIRRHIAVVLCALAVAACAAPGPTLYGPEINDYGYTETRLENGEWQISFTGNHLTERQITRCTVPRSSPSNSISRVLW